MKLLTFDSGLESFQKDQVVNVEVDTEEDHEHSQDGFKVLTVIVAYTCAVVRETACTGSSEHIDEAVKQRHPSCEKKDQKQCGHRKINTI